jgi:hypothetical protein
MTDDVKNKELRSAQVVLKHKRNGSIKKKIVWVCGHFMNMR